MPTVAKTQVIRSLTRRFGALRALPNSRSLFVIGDDLVRIYFRYSKLHSTGRAFFGLRKVDLKQLEGHNSFICLLSDDATEPLFVRYADFEEVFHAAVPASDGQYKVQLYVNEDVRELYIARCGRFNVEAYVGLDTVDTARFFL